MGDPNDPFADLVPTARTGYIPGVPKPRDPLDQRIKEITVAKGERDLAQSPTGDKPNQIPPAAVAGIQSDMESLRAVRAARQRLDGRPESIGPGTGMLGDTFTQFHDPDGTDVRSRVGKIGAVTIHDLSGAAVSATEAPRFQPFVPTVTDRPDVAKEKLRNFEEALRATIKERLDYFNNPTNGYKPYTTPQVEQFLKGDQPAPAPNEAPQRTTGGFADDPRAPGEGMDKPHAEEFRKGLYSAMSGKKINSPADMAAWVNQFNQQNGTDFHPQLSAKDTIEAIRAARQGKPFDVELPKYNPDISDVRGHGSSGAIGSMVINPLLGLKGDAVEATARGFLDTPSMGTVDKVIAGADTLFKGGTMADNLARQYAISDYDTENHPYARFGGQIAGGSIIPMGEMSSLGQIMGKSAALGAGYGAGSSRSLSDLPKNVILGGAAGGAVGGALGGAPIALSAFRRAPRAVPELVDPATGALNQPLEAMSPGQRVAAAQQFGIDLPADAAGGRSAAIVGKGLDIMPGSAGVMEDARRATEGQVANAAGAVADRFGSSRTLSEGGAELQRGAAERIDRGKDVISKAYNAIPIAADHPASSSNAIASLRELTGRFASNPDLADSLRDPRLVTYMAALEKGGLSWQDLKAFRSLVGEKIGDLRFGEGHSTQDLRALYGALSEDMRTTAATLGPRASRAFDRANSLNRENQNLIEGALTRILGPDGKLSPEKAAAAVAAMTKGGKSTGDLRALAQIRSATVKSGAWDEIASTLIRLGGQPANSAGRDFNPQTFVNWYADMAQPARNLLFGKGELRTALDQFVAVNQRLMKVNALRNTSNTAGSMTAAGTVGVMGAALLNPMLGVKMAAMGAGNYAMAKVWTNPAFVRWATGFAKASTPAAAKSQMGRLAKLATTNPELRAPIESLLRAANDNLGTVGRAAAGSDTNTDQQ